MRTVEDIAEQYNVKLFRIKGSMNEMEKNNIFYLKFPFDDEELFCDIVHLSSKGREKYTNTLLKKIEEISGDEEEFRMYKNEEMKILVIIPAYNEEKNIKETVERLKESAASVDYVVINDCSKDRTERILKNLGITYISLPVNLGIGGAVQTGYKYGVENGYDIAIQMDGDGQHDPKYLDTLIAPIVSGTADVVIGSRFLKKEGFQSSRSRRIGIRILGMLVSICCIQQIKDVTSGFRAVNKEFMQVFAKDYPQDYPEPESIVAVAMHKGKIAEVPVKMCERHGGESSISFGKSVYYMIKVSLAILICRISFGVRRKK